MNKNGITWKLEKGEQSFLHMTHCVYLRHISKNTSQRYHKWLSNYGMCKNENDTNKHKTRKCNISEMKKCKITISVCNTLS